MPWGSGDPLPPCPAVPREGSLPAARARRCSVRSGGAGAASPAGAGAGPAAVPCPVPPAAAGPVPSHRGAKFKPRAPAQRDGAGPGSPGPPQGPRPRGSMVSAPGHPLVPGTPFLSSGTPFLSSGTPLPAGTETPEPAALPEWGRLGRGGTGDLSGGDGFS